MSTESQSLLYLLFYNMLNRESDFSKRLFQKFRGTDRYEEFELDADYLLGSVGRKLARHDFPRKKKRRLECNALKKLLRNFHYQRKRQLLSKNVLQHTQETLKRNQFSLRNNLYVLTGCVSAIKRSVAMIEGRKSTLSAAKYRTSNL